MKKLRNIIDFKVAQTNLSSAYGKILTSGVLLDDSQKTTDIKERVKNLEESRFIVTVCGEMNSGKSTLLNAIIFSDEVLPMSATSQTAKLCKIEYGESPKLLVTFYSTDEWSARVKYIQKIGDEAWKKLEEEISTIHTQGVQKIDYIKHENRVIEGDLRELLTTCVAPVEKGGILMPFVRDVTVKYPANILKEITIIDSPGLHDSDVVRSKITIDWIGRSDAILFVMPAKFVNSEQDRVFIDEYLPHIRDDHRILAITKTDTLNKDNDKDELSTIKSHVKRLATGDDLAARKIYGGEVHYVSALGALISRMRELKITLSERLDEEASSKKIQEYFLPSSHLLGDLEDAVYRKLVENKGDAIIESHRQYIQDVFSRGIRDRTRKIDALKLQITDYGKTVAELNKEVNTYKLGRKSFKAAIMESLINVRKRGQEFRSTIKRKLLKHKDDMRKEVASDIQKMDNLGTISTLVETSINDAFERHEGQITDHVTSEYNKFEAWLKKDALPEIKSELEAMAIAPVELAGFVFDVDVGATLGEIKRKIKKSVKEQKIGTKASEEVGWLKWFGAGKEKAINYVKSKYPEELDKAIDENIVDAIWKDLEEQTNELMSAIETDMTIFFEEKEKLCADLKKDVVNREKEISSRNSEIDKLNKEIADITKIERNILSEMEG
jgi:predicted GTPase